MAAAGDEVDSATGDAAAAAAAAFVSSESLRLAVAVFLVVGVDGSEAAGMGGYTEQEDKTRSERAMCPRGRLRQRKVTLPPVL